MSLRSKTPGTLVPAIVLMVSLTGCGAHYAGAPSAAVPAEEGGDHHDEHEHLEHHIPEHRPADFSTAVDQIAGRFAALEGMETDQLPETPLHELEDILRWLPEIAADSDMRRQHWEQVDRLAGELTAELNLWAQLPAKDRTRLPSPIEAAIAALTDLKGTEHLDLLERGNG